MRHAQISEGGRVETFLLGTHESQAHKLVIEPGSPHIFYSCGEDALVQHVIFSVSLFSFFSGDNLRSIALLNMYTILTKNNDMCTIFCFFFTPVSKRFS